MSGRRKARTESNYPEGADFLEGTFRMELACTTTTKRAIPQMGNLAPQTWSHLGTCLSLLDRLATCHWECSGGDHTCERLVLRTLNAIRAGISLTRAGFYDEALNTLRGASEIVNLLQLFELDPKSFHRWRQADASERWDLASPGKVRKMLEELGQASLLDKDRYDQLSQIVHGTTTSAPQEHNPLEVPMAGGHFQYGGFLVALNDAALVTALLMLPATSLIPLTRERWTRFHDAAELLVENTDFVGLEQAAETHAQERARPEWQEIGRLIREQQEQHQGPRGCPVCRGTLMAVPPGL